MGYLVGTDEAGYAPNLGPLVISATVWKVPGDPGEADLYRLLAPVVRAAPARTRTGKNGRTGNAIRRRPATVVLSDSKVLYQPADGLGALERGVLAALGLMGDVPRTCHELWTSLDPLAENQLAGLSWYVPGDVDLPVDERCVDVPRQVAALRKVATRRGVELVAVRSRAVFPALFNRLTRKYESKGLALSHLTLDLLADVLWLLDDGPILAVCDKHGGRNFYWGLLQSRVSEHMVNVCTEGRDDSTYCWGPADRQTRVRFCPRAERYVPAALASMVSKYLRELSMRAFNQFWMERVPGLHPTAGYPGDAARFKTQIATAQSMLGIDDEHLWREK